VIAIDADGGEVTDPFQLRCLAKGVPVMGKRKVAGLSRCDRQEEVCCVPKRGVDPGAGFCAVEDEGFDPFRAQDWGFLRRAAGSADPGSVLGQRPGDCAGRISHAEYEQVHDRSPPEAVGQPV